MIKLTTARIMWKNISPIIGEAVVWNVRRGTLESRSELATEDRTLNEFLTLL